MIFQTLLTAAVVACTLLCEPIVCLTSPQNVAQIKDILCILLLNGVEKEDIDANTLGKLQKLHVNINDWNNKHKDDCVQAVASAHSKQKSGDIWNEFVTATPQSVTTIVAETTKESNFINLPKLEELLNTFKTSNITTQATTKAPNGAASIAKKNSVMNFLNSFAQNKAEIESTTTLISTSTLKEKKSKIYFYEKEKNERPNIILEIKNVPQNADVVINNISDKRKQTSTTVEPITPSDPNNHYAGFIDLIYSGAMGLLNQQKHDMSKEAKKIDKMNADITAQRKDILNNLFAATNVSELVKMQKAAQQAPAIDTTESTHFNMPIHILQVKPIKINYAATEKPPETNQMNASSLYSDTIKEIANEVKRMFLAQLKQEIPAIVPTTTSTTTTTTTQTQKTKQKAKEKVSMESSETKKKLDETNGMVLKLLGLFQKLELVQQNTLNTMRPVLGPPLGQLPMTSKSMPTVVPAQTHGYNHPAPFTIPPYVKKTTRIKPTKVTKPIYGSNRMPFYNMALMPPQQMPPSYLPMNQAMSFPLMQNPNENLKMVPPNIYKPVIKSVQVNPLNPYAPQIRKPSLVPINAKTIQTNEFMVMPLRVPINVKGERDDVQRLIDNQNIVLLQTSPRTTLRKATTTNESTKTTVRFRSHQWKKHKKFFEYSSNSNVDSREREKIFDSRDRERIPDSRDRDRMRFSKEVRDDRSRELMKVKTKKDRQHRFFPKQHYKRQQQQRDNSYDRPNGFVSDEKITLDKRSKYHHDYKFGEKMNFRPDPIYRPEPKFLDDIRYREDYNQKAVEDSPIRDDPKLFNDDPPRNRYEKVHLHDFREPPEQSPPDNDSFEKLIKPDSGENNRNYEQRALSPINKPTATKFSEKHFKNFLSTQQKVNSMLEKILSAKSQVPRV